MGLNIKNAEVVRLAQEVAAATGETKTEAIRRALLDRQERLGMMSTQNTLKSLHQHLSAILKDRQFAPVLKDEWDRLHE